MKLYAACLIIASLTGLAGAAPADSLVHLTQPALTGIGIAGRTACVGTGFNADGSIVGACHTVTSPPCSGRGCQPVTTTTNYFASWNAAGEATGVSACNTVRHHLPQADVVTPLNGYAICPSVSFTATGSTVVLNGTPFYYVATDPVSGAELLNNSTAGYLSLPDGLTPDAPGKFY